MGRIAHRVQKGGFRLNKVAFGEQGYAEIVIVIGALVIPADFRLEITDVFVNVVITFFHGWPPHRANAAVGGYFPV